MDRRVEGDIGIDQLRQRRACAEFPAGRQGRFGSAAFRGRHLARLHALRRQPRRQSVQRLAHQVEIADAATVERRHLQPALAVLDQKPAPLEHLQGVTDGLARHAQHRGHALLRQPLPGRQRAVGNGAQEAVVHLIDQRRLDVELQHARATRF